MSKDIILNEQTFSGVSEVELPVSGGTAFFKDKDEIVEPSGTLEITANGERNVTEYEKVNVNVQGGATPTYQEKTATENGVVLPDEGYDALSKVTVNVSGGGGGTLPNEYQEVEWIASDGNQYINTQYVPTNTTGVRVRFLSNLSGLNDHYVCGSRTSGVDDRYYAVFRKPNGYGYGWNQSSNFTGTPPSYPITTELNYLNSRKTKADGVEIGNISANYSGTTYPLYIFGTNISGSFDTTYSLVGQIEYVNISEGSNVVHKFVPCYRKADDVIGMYDIIGGSFYTNAGTGTFTKGADAG